MDLRRDRVIEQGRDREERVSRSFAPRRVWRGAGSGGRVRGSGFDEFGARVDPRTARTSPRRLEAWRNRPGEEQIRRRAYEIHVRNGREGNAALDWLEAEQELLAELRARRASGSVAPVATFRECPLQIHAFSSSSAPPAISRAASFFRRSMSSTPRGTCRPRPESSV
ncbi:MAG: DUF2934 domain-containing protein [Phycisphaerales bacterium]